MSLRIFVNDYHESMPLPVNTTVTGYIQVALRKAKQQARVTQIPLVFFGHIRTDICYESGCGQNRTTERYSSKSLLFSHSYILTKPAFKSAPSRRGEDGGTLTFPFQFLIPKHAEGVPRALTEVEHGPRDDEFPGSVGYDQPDRKCPPFPLPDTMKEFHAYTANASETTARATVRYTIQAKPPGLSSVSKLWMEKAEDQCDILIFNPVSFPYTPPQVRYKTLRYMQTVRSMRLLASHKDQNHLSFRENMRRVFKKDKLPYRTLGLSLAVPDTLLWDVPGEQPLSIFINIQRLASGVIDAETDNVDVKSSQLSSRSDSKSPHLLPYDDTKRDKQSHTYAPANSKEKHHYLGPLSQLPGPTLDSGPLEAIPNPDIHLSRLTLNLVSHTSLRGSEPNTKIRSGMTYECHTSALLYAFRPRRGDAAYLVPIRSPLSVSLHPSSQNSSKTTASDGWLDLGPLLGITHGHLHTIGQHAKSIGMNTDGSLQGEFVTPNLRRSWGLEWDLRVVARLGGEKKEVRWRRCGVRVGLVRGY